MTASLTDGLLLCSEGATGGRWLAALPAEVVAAPAPAAARAGPPGPAKHVSRVLDKLGASNRTEAVARARQLGLLR